MGKRRHARPANFYGSPWFVTLSRPESECSTTARLAVLLAFGVSACANNPIGIQGRWLGTVKPVSGVCDPPSQAVLTIEQGKSLPYAAVFAPTSGVLMLHGSSDGVGQVTADLHTIGANHQPYILSFSGTKDGNVIIGTYITQRCRSDIELQRK